MSASTFLRRQFRIQQQFGVRLLAISVGLHGLFILATTLLDQIAARHGSHLSDVVVDLPLLLGLSLMYLSTLLLRRKRTAWLATVLTYTFYLGVGADNLLRTAGFMQVTGLQVIRVLVLPATILALLLYYREAFVVRSDIQGFRAAARFSIIILVAALVYGVAGFLLLDRSDFHQEIPPASAIHYTVDRFDLTTSHPLHPYTKRAHLFIDSLSFVSAAAVIYAVVSLFQPLRLRWSDQGPAREHMHQLLTQYGGSSEDYFKLWPSDKQFFFDSQNRSGLAFHVYHGVALCLGDPAGDKRQFADLLETFRRLCFGNDWLPAFIHVPATHRRLYEKHGFSLQKIGQEAVLDIARFETSTARNKYFRHIRNKFTKQGFSCELLQPPHHSAILERLHVISNEWLGDGGRVERGFAMGYYSTDYMQQCPVLVARDAAGTIQAFINQLPADFDRQEADFDLLRHTRQSPGNINDFLLMGFIGILHEQGYHRLNLGLCPLTGLHETENKGLLDNVLRFAYANGDRFYSFSGLYQFKSKYEPDWRDRYIAYQSGVRGFSRTTNALMRSMRVKKSAITK